MTWKGHAPRQPSEFSERSSDAPLHSSRMVHSSVVQRRRTVWPEQHRHGSDQEAGVREQGTTYGQRDPEESDGLFFQSEARLPVPQIISLIDAHREAREIKPICRVLPVAHRPAARIPPSLVTPAGSRVGPSGTRRYPGKSSASTKEARAATERARSDIDCGERNAGAVLRGRKTTTIFGT